MSALKLAFQALVKETLDDLQQSSGSQSPEEGTVTSVNDDGTVNVQTNSNNYTSVGAATTDVQIVGAIVMVISGDSTKVAVPR